MTNPARFVAVCAVVAFGFTAIADGHKENDWQSDTTEGLSGNYLTVGHWSLDHVPESGEIADFRKSSSFSVTMPSGTYASPAGFRAGLGADGTTFRMDFSNTTWTDPGYLNADVVYGAWLDVAFWALGLKDPDTVTCHEAKFALDGAWAFRDAFCLRPR